VVPFVDTGSFEHLLSEFLRVEDVVGVLANGFQPFFVFLAGQDSEDILEEDIVTEGLDLIFDLLLLFVSVDFIDSTDLGCSGEEFPARETNDLEQNWFKILVSG
jgi:hypothetical protein